MAQTSSVARATILTFGADLEFSGGTAPAGSTPWITVTLDDGGGVGSVAFTLSATNLTSSENISELDLNLDPTLYGDLPLSFTGLAKTGAFNTPSISQGVDGYKADGDGKYDISLGFAVGGTVSQTFTQGDVLKYTITGSGITATSFQFLSTPAGGHGPFVMAAHIQNTPSGGGFSGWVADSGGGTVNPAPEPSSLVLLALGACAVVAWCASRRRRRSE